MTVAEIDCEDLCRECGDELTETDRERGDGKLCGDCRRTERMAEESRGC